MQHVGKCAWHGGHRVGLTRAGASVDDAGVESTSYEIAVVVLGSYLAYLVAEVAGGRAVPLASWRHMP